MVNWSGMVHMMSGSEQDDRLEVGMIGIFQVGLKDPVGKLCQEGTDETE